MQREVLFLNKKLPEIASENHGSSNQEIKEVNERMFDHCVLVYNIKRRELYTFTDNYMRKKQYVTDFDLGSWYKGLILYQTSVFVHVNNSFTWHTCRLDTWLELRLHPHITTLDPSSDKTTYILITNNIAPSSSVGGSNRKTFKPGLLQAEQHLPIKISSDWSLKLSLHIRFPSKMER